MPVKEKIKFPDLQYKWPFPRTCSPYPEVAAESDEWIQSFKAFPTQEEMDAFKSCNFGMSTPFPLWPWISPDYPNRYSSPIVPLFSLPEERLVPVEPHCKHFTYTLSLTSFHRYFSISLRHNQPCLRLRWLQWRCLWRHGTMPGGHYERCAAQPPKASPRRRTCPRWDYTPVSSTSIGLFLSTLYWPASRFQTRVLGCASMTYQRHNIALWDLYIDSVVQEGKDKNAGLIRDLASFIPLRRGTIALYLMALMTTLDSEVPPQVYDHPTMQRMLDLISDIIFIENVRSLCSADYPLLRLSTADSRIGYVLIPEGGRCRRIP